MLTVMTTPSSAHCPICAQPSARVHSHYARFVADLPMAGRAVHLCLQVRKFFCGNPRCRRSIFAERLPKIVAPYARRSCRLADDQRQLALDHGGEAGARTAHYLGMPTSPDTLLRLIRRVPAPAVATPRVLGVDDFAWRKGRTYGTILVDLEQQHPIDLLPDRTAEALVTWLQAHPGVQIISRDRAGAYADGAARGAPDATQVADRFHLLQNLRETLQRLLDRHQPALQAAGSEPAPVLSGPEPTEAVLDPAVVENTVREQAESPPLPMPTRVEQDQQARRMRRQERYQDVLALQADGLGVRAIARHLHISRDTVKRFLGAGTFPERARPPRKPSILDPFLPYLQAQWMAGCTNGMQLWREIVPQGYGGSRALVARWVVQQRGIPAARTASVAPYKGRGRPPAPARPQPPGRPVSARRAAWLMVRARDDLKEAEVGTLDRLLDACPAAAAAYPLAHAFLRMVRERDEQALTPWLVLVEASELPELCSFAAGLRRDEQAVRAGVRLPYSQGQVEGQVNRLKLIKRSMYGRANFDLLRHRVLAA